MEFLIMVLITLGALIHESYQKHKAKKYSEEHLPEGIAAYNKKWHLDN